MTPIDQEKIETTQTVVHNVVRDMYSKLFRKLHEKSERLAPPEFFFSELGCQLAIEMLLANFGVTQEVSKQYSEDDVMEANVHLAATVLYGFTMTCISGKMNWDKFFTRVEEELAKPGRLEMLRKQFADFKEQAGK
jgi:hypothetical protein